MTTVLTTLSLARPVDDQVATAIANATSIYGIRMVKLSSAMDKVTVEYDATRLKPEHVPATLNRAGVPVQA